MGSHTSLSKKIAVPESFSSVIEEAHLGLYGTMKDREPDFTLKKGWFSVAEFCQQTKHDPNKVKKKLDAQAKDGDFESQLVRGLDIGGLKRMTYTVYRQKKETPNAKLDRSKRPVSV